MTKKLVQKFKMVPLTEDIIFNSFSSNLMEFEDNIQLFSAKNAGVDYIITRNIKHFKHADVEALTPEELLDKLGIN
ncbi:MAG: hypothetical protein ACE5J9_06285 [Methanosarcinales archaeon]